MTWHGPTFRISDGETIDGAWRLVWIKHDRQDDYYPEDLFVYADGRITRGRYDPTDLAGLEKLLASGKVALARPDGREWTPPPSKWLARYPEPLTDESFLAEVADEISRLAGRPTTVDLLHEAIRGYQRDTTEASRSLLRDAYLAVPAHLRVYVLGDMDRQDQPLRTLVTDLGEPVDGDGPAATPEMHREALDYFADGDERVERAEREQAVRYADAPAGDPQPPVVLNESVYPRGWPAELGKFALRNDYDAPFTYGGGDLLQRGARLLGPLRREPGRPRPDPRRRERPRGAGAGRSGRGARGLGRPEGRRHGGAAAGQVRAAPAARRAAGRHRGGSDPLHRHLRRPLLA